MTEDELEELRKPIREELAKLDLQEITHLPHRDRDPNSIAPVEDGPSEGSTGNKDLAKRRAELEEKLRKL
jgi:hypothetical protein